MAQSLRQGTDILEFPSGQAGCMLAAAMSGAFRVEPIECDLIVSLGTNCELAYNLRHFYGIEHAGLFDWTITPLSCLPGLIRRRFALVDEDFARSLVRVDLANGDSIMHAPTGILLHHAFTRDEHDRISPGWGDEIPDVAAKFRFLGERMNTWLQEANLPALFINRAGIHDALDREAIERCYTADAYERIVQAIQGTYPHVTPLFCILNGNEQSTSPIMHRADVRLAMTKDYGDWHEGIVGHFAGCATGWGEAVDSLHIRAVGSSAMAVSRAA